jgi:NAD(P)H-dependent flavin oxidoreductase YrpB (nitropropane dioxygenase family)
MPFQLKTRVCDMLGMQYPIFAFTHKVPVVIAVSKAGGFPVYGATRDTPEEIEQVVREVRAAIGNRPFGLNLVLPEGMPEEDNRDLIEAQIPQGHRQFVKGLWDKYQVPPNTKPAMRTKFIRSKSMNERQIQTVMDSDVPLLAFGIGAPPEVVQEAHLRGKKVLALVGNPKHAVRALNKGVDLLVAQGHESAAHTGNITTFSLVPQVVDVSGDVPVLAAGGVATGRHIMASLALGAQGVWCGTTWLLTKEWGLDPIIQKKLMAARSEDTLITRSESGKTFRQIRSAWSEEWENPEAPRPLRMPLQDVLVGDLLGAILEHRVEPLMHHAAGQGIAYQNQVKSVEEVLTGLVREAEASMQSLNSSLNTREGKAA